MFQFILVAATIISTSKYNIVLKKLISGIREHDDSANKISGNTSMIIQKVT